MYYNVLAVLIILFTSVCHLQQCFICAVYMSYILLSASWCLMSYSSKCRIMKCYCYSEIYYILCRIIKRSGCYISVMSYNVLTVLNVSYTSTCRFIKWLFCSYYILLCIVSYNVLAALFMSCTSECCMVCIMFWLFCSFSCHMQVWVSTRVISCFGCSVIRRHLLLGFGLYHVLTLLFISYTSACLVKPHSDCFVRGILLPVVNYKVPSVLFVSYISERRVMQRSIRVLYFCVSCNTLFLLFCLYHILHATWRWIILYLVHEMLLVSVTEVTFAQYSLHD